MRKKEQKSLEDMARALRRSVKLPKFEPLDDFETKVKKIARKYNSSDDIRQEGSHRYISIMEKKIFWSPRQRGREKVLSAGVFEKSMEYISEVTGISCEQLELYFKGAGKLYKIYKRRFEDEYGL